MGLALAQTGASALSRFTVALRDELLVLSGLRLGLKCCSLFQSAPSPLALQRQWGHKPLDLGGLGIFLAALLPLDLPSNNVFADIILLRTIKQLANIVGTLRSKPSRDNLCGKTLDLLTN